MPGEIPVAKPVTSEEELYGHKLLNELSQQYELDYDHPRRAEVDNIMSKITSSLGASKMPWHVHVFKAPEVKNAAATKGNHIFVWTGMIDATKDESELAGILSHEVAHVIARHTDPTDEENLRQILVNIGAFAAGTAASIAVGGAGAQMAGQIASNATNKLGSGILVYPYDRQKELEADQIGLFITAKSGYDPKSVINFWQRALNDPSFSSGIPFLSTHPPAADRLANLQRLEPLAEKSTHSTNSKGQAITQNLNSNDSFSVPPKIKNQPVATPTLSAPISNPVTNNSRRPLPKSSASNQDKVNGIKSEEPLPANDSFNVGPNIMKEKFGN